MANNKVFNYTGNLHPGRSAFDLSELDSFDCNFGELIPVWFREVYPGDVIKYAQSIAVRFGAMVSPSFVNINYRVDLFYMPSRLLQGDEFEKFFREVEPDLDLHAEGSFSDFISGMYRGKPATPEQQVTLPRWTSPDTSKYSLWDYFGLPVGVTCDPLPIDFPRRMYNAVWNEYYRNEFIESQVAHDNQQILLRNWRRDYFTSALPGQQLGTPVALPVQIGGSTSFSGSVSGSGRVVFADPLQSDGTASSKSTIASNSNVSGTLNDLFVYTENAVISQVPNGRYYTTGSVDGSAYSVSGQIPATGLTATTFTPSDMREAFQIQKWQERNQRGGVRYTEFLRSHYGVSPSDARLDRPVHIGGSSAPVLITEVQQTSSTDSASPQGNLAGHGIGVSQGFVGSYRVEEFGYVMALFSIVPSRGAYFQGVPRELLRETPYDFYFPEFANLSEQAVTQQEIYASTDRTSNETVFGFQGRYNELRVGRDKVVGSFRDTLLHWTFARKFDSAPLLNQSFAEISTENDSLNRIFAVQTDPDTEEPVPNILVNFHNIVKAIRPMPYLAEPGLIDHH